MKNLLIFVVGNDHTEINRWEYPGKEFDIAFAFWGDREPAGQLWNFAKYVLRQKGMKMHLVRDLIIQNPEILNDYDSVMIFDDDIFISQKHLKLFFEIYYGFGFGIACPGFMAMATDRRFNRKPEFVFRTSNTIDINSACLSRKALNATWPIIQTSDFGHGWGITEWWQEIYHKGIGFTVDGERIGIIDCVPAEHTKKPGANYAQLNKFGDPYKEMENQYLRHVGRPKNASFGWKETLRFYEMISISDIKPFLEKQ